MYTATGRLDRQQSIAEHLPMVRRQALSLQVRLPASVDLDDLVQAGTVGLLDAYDRFSADQGASFATYAAQRVRGAMLDELRSRDWLPRSVRRSGRALHKTIERLAQEKGRPPRETEIAAAMDLSLDDYRALLVDVNNGLIVAYQEESDEETEASVLHESVEQGADPFVAALEGAKNTGLIEAIDALPEREKMLLGLYYQEELNLKEIGAVLGVTESRVCQLHSQAVARLRKAMTDYR